ncbi:DUF4136 domain-containing protein [Robertkochia aurantiaca]|uniref:DUF4136 domain-containing protein n=1 Tax=Robertkochia aurantiaca TaxID=2873700 RepID=UPI001CCAC06B|nr:DUF4136 domain-containing protein [Robertkochia sp. 3YJGBD-33]
MKRFAHHLFLCQLFLIILVLQSCASGSEITHSYTERNFSFEQYETFAFADTQTSGDIVAETIDPKIELIKSQITKALESKGLSRVNDNPELLVNLGIAVSEQVQTRQTDFITDAPRYIGQRNYKWESEEIPVGTYKKGTLDIHLVDTRIGELVWQRSVSRVITENQKNIPKDIEEAVEKAFGL